MLDVRFFHSLNPSLKCLQPSSPICLHLYFKKLKEFLRNINNNNANYHNKNNFKFKKNNYILSNNK